jgi:hypothetical protein
MSIFDHYFGKSANLVKDYTIAPNNTVKEFGKVYVRENKDKLQVQFTILMPPQGQAAEGWKTGVALDASSSMTTVYGRELQGELPANVTKDYEKKGWIRYQEEDGQRFRIFERIAVQDALAKGYFHYSENLVEPVARKFIAYLANELDVDGSTAVIYWACGNGSHYEELGDIQATTCEQLTIQGPKSVTLGSHTYLQPALEYFVNRFSTATRSMYIFITDGYIDDLETVKRYSHQIAEAIATGKRHLIKCILIGVGKAVDERQMTALDDLDTGTDIDLWDHKIADNMRDLIEIFAELVDENQIVAPVAVIHNSEGHVVKKFADGLPAKVTIDLPPKTQWFELEVMGRRIRQTVVP